MLDTEPEGGRDSEPTSGGVLELGSLLFLWWARRPSQPSGWRLRATTVEAAMPE